MPIPIVLEKRAVKERIENARRTYEITLPKGEIDFNNKELKEKIANLLYDDYFKERNLGDNIDLFRESFVTEMTMSWQARFMIF